MIWLAVAWAETCPVYGAPEELPAVQAAGLAESSGVAASRVQPGVFFTHDDDGPPRLYAFDASGSVVGTFEVPDADNEDWEDIAAAPCPDKGDCLYIGDIGDNNEDRPNITVYVVREPEAGDSKVKGVARYTAVFPDGPRDAEALLVQPCTGRIHLVTKAGDGLSTIYRMPFDPGRDAVSLEEVGKVQIEGPTAEARRVSGGDWDIDGERLVLRTASQILEWNTDPDAPNAHWSDAPRVIVGADERKGEAVAFDLDGGLVTTSEGTPMPVSRFPCSTEPSSAECVFPQTGGCGCATGHPSSGLWVLLGLGWLRRRQSSSRHSSMRDQPS